MYLLVYKCIQRLAPPFLAAFCQEKSDRPGHSRLRSANLCQLHVPRTRTTFGDRSFSVNGPAVWSSLPVDPRARDISIDILKQQQKAFFYGLSTNLRICGLSEFSARYKCHYYYHYHYYYHITILQDRGIEGCLNVSLDQQCTAGTGFTVSSDIYHCSGEL